MLYRSKPEKVAGLPSMFYICGCCRKPWNVLPKGKDSQRLADFKRDHLLSLVFTEV